jgi:hypothetical protein
MTIKDFLSSYFESRGPASIEISIDGDFYSIKQTSATKRIVPLFVSEIGSEEAKLWWLLPVGKSVFWLTKRYVLGNKLCGDLVDSKLDARIPYVFNSNGRGYVRVSYSQEVHQLIMDSGIERMNAGAKFAYIRDLANQINR